MYTQCPECSTAFRVTADILKQAAGKVRCGGCGRAFNALEYLSETAPEQKPSRAAEENLPELKPEPLDDGGLPKSISAEQSAALLKTLDELAGSDIRIEDTGVEWRVLDEDEIGEAAGDPIAVDIDVEDQPVIDEILEASPTPVDQFLTNTPPEIDAPEIFAESEPEAPPAPVDELRFDDNTPLPDDFNFDDETSHRSEPQANTHAEPEPVAAAEPQADIDLSEPDEWTDILDEFEDLVDELAEADDPGTADQDTEHPDGIRGDEEHGDETPLDVDEDVDAAPQETDDEDQVLEDLLGDRIVEVMDEEDDEVVAESEQDDVAKEFGQLDLIDEVEDAAESDEPADDEPDEHAVADHIVPPMTEEEQTINMQIDQDLLAIAIEDKDGLASTMLLPEDTASGREDDADDAHDDETGKPLDMADTGTGFETIIMEGDIVRSELDAEKLAADIAAAAELAGAAAAEREAEEATSERGVSYGMVAGIIVLALLLLGQLVHQSRNTLATIPAFNDTVGPIYRAIGQPLSPDWDITGWRFEATQGQADEGNENLTIYSRIGNNSDRPLPFPLISVSLTDRFEDVIGNRVLDPADYLVNDLDPRKLVAPGETFNASITIHSPGADAVSFRLRACYRSEGGQLRCKEDGFK